MSRSQSTETGLSLPTGALLRIDAPRKVTVVVRQGALWITTTPADRDIIVRAGQTFVVESGWPVLVQALAVSDIVLTPAPGRDVEAVAGTRRRRLASAPRPVLLVR